MKRPLARPTTPSATTSAAERAPRAFAATKAEPVEPDFDPEEPPETLVAPRPRRAWPARLAWGALSLLVTAGLGLVAERLIRDLFAAHAWLGWLGSGLLAVFILAVLALGLREILALRRLAVLDTLKAEAGRAHAENDMGQGEQVLKRLLAVYAARPDMARARQEMSEQTPQVFDGSELIALAERRLMARLDARAKALTAISARRMALVTAVSPRAFIDVLFVVYESVRLTSAIAALYGARPGFFGFWRLVGAILAHLAVTGGLVLSEGAVEQLLGQGLVTKLSTRLGEGVINGLMTVRIGIAAMRVVRPLPFTVLPQPKVRDFIPELTRLAQDSQTATGRPE